MPSATEDLRAVAETRRELGGTVATIAAWVCIAIINVAHARAR